MIYTSRIKRTLNFLEEEYQRNLYARDIVRPTVFAKLALLEYCGWLEEAFDEICRNGVRKSLRTKSDRKLLECEIRKVNGFDYKDKIRPLVATSVGTKKLLEIERKLKKTGHYTQLTSNLGSIKAARNEAAHEFTKLSTLHFQAPSVTINNFENTAPILQEYWSLISQ